MEALKMGWGLVDDLFHVTLCMHFFTKILDNRRFSLGCYNTPDFVQLPPSY